MPKHYKHNGFSLIELLIYVALLSIFGSLAWRSIQWAQDRRTQMDTLITISSNSGAGLEAINSAIANAAFPPKIFNATTGIYADTQCLEVTNRNNVGAYNTTSFWFGLDNATAHYSLYKGSILCNATPTSSNLKKITDPLFIKIINATPFFVSTGDIIQFNFKINKKVGNTNYDIKQNEATATKRFIKLAGTQGCKISSTTSLFSSVIEPTKTLEVAFSNGYNATLDRLKFKYNATSITCGTVASPATLYNTPSADPYVIFYTDGNYTNTTAPPNTGKTCNNSNGTVTCVSTPNVYKWIGVRDDTHMVPNSSVAGCDHCNWGINDMTSSLEVGPAGATMTLFQNFPNNSPNGVAVFTNIAGGGKYSLINNADWGLTSSGGPKARDNDCSSFYLNKGPDSKLTCSFDTSTGKLNFISTVPFSGSDWAKIVSDVEYSPASSISSDLLKGITRTLSFKLDNTSQGTMLLDLYPLARSCADTNFAP